jgi:hypothetical protein
VFVMGNLCKYIESLVLEYVETNPNIFVYTSNNQYYLGLSGSLKNSNNYFVIS